MGTENSNALGVPDFGEAEMFALETLLNGKTDEEVENAFASEHPDTSPESIRSALAKIHGSVVFRPLLAD